MSLPELERNGAFYLGREVQSGVPFHYPSQHLCTHGVVIGMTGSGKTGLSIDLLEEAALQGVPAIVIDPKGDLGNLLLTFPELQGEDFAPWVPPGADPAAEASRWREGLAAWDQGPERIARLRETCELTLFTPGSRSGQPLSILGTLAAPAADLDAEQLAERATQVATSLLGLVQREAEGGSREHVLVSTLLADAWREGRGLDLAELVERVQNPPFDKVGVLPLESFFPKKERFQLAVQYNALLATPGFEAWTAGPPLDIDQLLRAPSGKPRLSILSIAHLDDAQRMFFVSLVLGQMVSWMRAQSGTPALRALFFMDEVVGYFPPVAMPPSKRPLMVLLKQARAFGLGVVLATQNPVDLDYKGLSNAGTWWIGRLQTERDKARVLDGLEGASHQGVDRAALERTLSGLGKRQFYVHDVHASTPTVIESRWSLSYLRGPLGRDELKRLCAAHAPALPLEPAAHAARHDTPQGAAGTSGQALADAPTQPLPTTSGPKGTVVMATPARASTAPPALPEQVPQLFAPSAGPAPHYEAGLLGAARITFRDARTDLDFVREVLFVTPIHEGPMAVDWNEARWPGELDLRTLARAPTPHASFGAVAGPARDPKQYTRWERDFIAWLTRTQGVTRWRAAGHKQLSAPQEDEATFRTRLAHLARADHEATVATIRAKYNKRFTALEEKIRRAQSALQREQGQASAARVEAGLEIGGGVLGALFGSGGRSTARAGVRAAKKSARASQQAGDVQRQQAVLDELRSRYASLQAEANAQVVSSLHAHDAARVPLEQVVTRAKKTGVEVHAVALLWRPRR